VYVGWVEGVREAEWGAVDRFQRQKNALKKHAAKIQKDDLDRGRGILFLPEWSVF